jgi:endonuclease I
MENAYPDRIKLEPEETRMFKKWDQADPVDKWECERCRRIEKLQGNKNSIVKDACKRQGKRIKIKQMKPYVAHLGK